MSEETFRIRPLTLADKDLALRFFDQMSPATLRFFNRNNMHRDSLLACFDGKRPDKRNFIAVCTNEQQEEEIAGYVFLWDLHYKTPWLGICVSEKWQGHGLGGKLMAHAENYCRQHGKGGIFLTTDPENFAGQKLYARSGYRQLGYLEEELLYFRFFEDAYPANDGTI